MSKGVINQNYSVTRAERDGVNITNDLYKWSLACSGRFNVQSDRFTRGDVATSGEAYVIHSFSADNSHLTHNGKINFLIYAIRGSSVAWKQSYYVCTIGLL